MSRYPAAPIGAERINSDGLLERKVAHGGAVNAARRWVGVHRLVWEAAHGPVPPGHAVCFKRGCATTAASEITLDRLELLSSADQMRRNSYLRFGPDIARLIQLRGALNRQLNKRAA